MVCDMTITGLRDGVATSGQSLANTEYAQVSQTADWPPPAVNVGWDDRGDLGLKRSDVARVVSRARGKK
jgi:hypothetical protein